MKKLALVAAAALLCAALAVPASALENQFGGYFDIRAVSQQDFYDKDDPKYDGDRDTSIIDSRTRIYYTAKISDNLKLVNKFEMDTVWGDAERGSSYGDIGADGVDVEIKNTYVDFTLEDFNFKLGTQPARLARGFLFDDDFSGAVVTYDADDYTIPVMWIKNYEGGYDNNSADLDYYVIAPKFNVGSFAINPYVLYAHSSSGGERWNSDDKIYEEDVELSSYYIGLDLDYSFTDGSVWFTGMYQGGDVTDPNGFFTDDLSDEEYDISAYLVAVGGEYDFGGFGLHGQAFYASGDDDLDDDDIDAFVGPLGQSYYWSEIMGLGMFDGRGGDINNASAGSCGDAITNIMAFNLGASVEPMEKLTVKLDVWYAELAEDNEFGEDELGTEVDLQLTYKLMDNLNLDVVGAYLFAGDATSEDGDNDEDPYEIGTRLSLKF